MNARFVVGLLLALAVSIGLSAQSAQDLYQRGLVQEHSRGDLKQALSLYAQVVQAAGRDRALAAKAMIRMGGLHEKLGARADAEKTYRQILEAYPEQQAEVAIAKERLKALRPKANKGVDLAPPPRERASDADLAIRLAAFLWNDVPDPPLLDAVRRGSLHDPAALTRQVVRMVRDRRSRLVDTFFAEWLSLDTLKSVRPDPALHPQVDAELLQAMDSETRLFLDSQLKEDRDAVEVWTAPYTYVNERLARHYGLTGITGRDFRRVTWPNTNRAGLLGQAGPLTALSFDGRTSPTMRGVFVLTRFIGEQAPPPPLNIPPLADDPPKQPRTMRDRLERHRTNPACASCHAMFDPYGLALENFDVVGAWRTVEKGLPIDPTGELPDGTRFNGPAELRAALLLKYRQAYYGNVTRRLLAFALNRKGKAVRIYDYEIPAVRKIVADASASGYRWSAIIAGVAASAPFQAKDLVP